MTSLRHMDIWMKPTVPSRGLSKKSWVTSFGATWSKSSAHARFSKTYSTRVEVSVFRGPAAVPQMPSMREVFV